VSRLLLQEKRPGSNVKRMQAGQVSSTDRQSKVSYGQMNHESLENVTSNKAQVKTDTYLGASIFLIKCRSGQPEWGVSKLQIGTRKQTLPQLNPENNGVQDAERV
jgi:hypothetical protein